MNLQTERMENHRAQLTIEIDSDQLEVAKQSAARQISQRVRIRGFRKGKAPYRLVAQHVGEAAILEEAIEALGDDLYRQALQESEILPYGPGAFEDFKIEPAPTFVFSVPLQPEVELNNYHEARLDFEAPAVGDEEVEQTLQQLRAREIQVLDADLQVAELGNRVRAVVNSTFVDGEDPELNEDEGDDATPEDPAASDDAGEEEQAGPDTESEVDEGPNIPKKGDTFVHDENAILILDPNEDPFMDGFVDAMIGAELDMDIEFELTIPDDDADETIAGRRVSFLVTLKQIESIEIPELDDDFAERMSKNRGDELLDMAGLRQATREDMEKAALERARTEYSGQILEKIVEGSVIEYPELMLGERIDEMINEFAENLKRQNLTLEDYFRYTGNSRETLSEQYQDGAHHSLKQTLALREFVKAQNIEISDEQIEMRLDLVVSGYGSSPEILKLFDTPQMRANLRNELLMSQINARLFAIGQEENPEEAAQALAAQLANDVQQANERSQRLKAYMEEQQADEAESVDAQSDVSADAVGDEAADSVSGESPGDAEITEDTDDVK